MAFQQLSRDNFPRQIRSKHDGFGLQVNHHSLMVGMSCSGGWRVVDHNQEIFRIRDNNQLLSFGAQSQQFQLVLHPQLVSM